MSEIIGFDFSRYQYLWNEKTGEMLRPLNFDIARAAGIRFAAGRVTLGASVDWAYEYRNGYCSLKASQAAGIPTTGYHVVRPALSPDTQMDAFFRALDRQKFYEDFPVWMDCERPDGLSPSAQTRVIAKSIERVWRERGYFPDIYTNVGYWNANTVHDPIFDQCKLVVANYTTAKTPLIPREWNKWFGLAKQWRIWQFSADGNGLGSKYGAASHSIDLDRFNGDELEFQAMMFHQVIPVPEPEPPAGDDEMKTVFLPLVNNQNIRSGPGTNYPSIGKIKIGQELYPARGACIKNAGEVWLRFDAGWVAAVHGGRQYLQAK